MLLYQVPPVGALLTLLAGLVAAAVLGTVYSFLTVYIPFVYLNFLFTFGFGLGLAVTVVKSAVASRIRSNVAPVIIAVVVALVAYYVAWGADRLARQGPPSSGVLGSFKPSVVRKHVGQLNARGAWTISRSPDAENINGVLLGIVWLIEAGVIIGMTVYGTYWIMRDATYCEDCQRWTEKVEDLARYAAGRERELVALLERGDFRALVSRPLQTAAAKTYLQLDAHFCSGCRKHGCLSLEKITLVADKQGKESPVTNNVVNKLMIGRDLIEKIVAATPKPPEATPAATPAASPTIGPPPPQNRLT